MFYNTRFFNYVFLLLIETSFQMSHLLVNNDSRVMLGTVLPDFSLN